MNQSKIGSMSGGRGNAGSISLTSNTAILAQDSIISSEAFIATGGDINVKVHDRFYIDDATINSQARGDASKGILPRNQGGNITIAKPKLFILGKNSQLVTRGYVNDGGNININADYLIKSRDGFVMDASSKFGEKGEIWINALEEDIGKDLTLLPTDSPTFKLSLSRCIGLTKDNVSRFLTIIRDTLPQAPGDLRTHFYIPEDEE